MTDDRCVFGQRCAKHNFIHGAEAEELRERFEALAADASLDDDARVRVQTILNDVDARDALAWMETTASRAGRGGRT